MRHRSTSQSGAQDLPTTSPLGPVNARVVCFQRRCDLVAVDPLRGETLWVRLAIRPNSEVFGDEHYVFVLSPGKTEADVYRATDGELLGTRKLPDVDNVAAGFQYDQSPSRSLKERGIVFLGRNVLTWGRGKDLNGRVLSLFDPWTQKPVWPERTFVAGARVDLTASTAVGVFEPSGHFVLLALDDGRNIADVQLKLRPHLLRAGLAGDASRRSMHRYYPRLPHCRS